MERAAHQRNSERKQTTSSVGSVGLSPLAGCSGRGIAARRAASRTWGGMATAALAMLSDERTAQNKKESIWPLRAWNIRPQPDDGNSFKCFDQYQVMQGSKEGKRANLWGPRTHFGANIPMKIGPEYQCLKKIRSEFQRLQKKHRNSNVLKNKIRIPMFIKIASEFP